MPYRIHGEALGPLSHRAAVIRILKFWLDDPDPDPVGSHIEVRAKLAPFLQAYPAYHWGVVRFIQNGLSVAILDIYNHAGPVLGYPTVSYRAEKSITQTTA